MANKPKTTQPETPNIVQGRDSFSTPNYAVDILQLFIPSYIDLIWECAAGKMKISDRLMHHGYSVYSSDIETVNGVYHHNFLTDPNPELSYPYAIITNPPFSLKYKFIHKAIEYNVPFAFLIPFDMCKQMADLFTLYNCQGVVPDRRIDYITPNILENIWRGESKKLAEKSERMKFKNWFSIPDKYKDKYGGLVKKYSKIDEVPQSLLAKYSTSQFHSFWLTRFFDLPEQLKFVELTNKMKENI